MLFIGAFYRRKISKLIICKACICYFSFFHQFIALYNYEKCFLFQLNSSFLFSRYLNFCIFVFPSFFPVSYLLWRMIKYKAQRLWHHQLSKWKFNTFCMISWEGKKVCHWNFLIDKVLNKEHFCGKIMQKMCTKS